MMGRLCAANAQVRSWHRRLRCAPGRATRMHRRALLGVAISCSISLVATGFAPSAHAVFIKLGDGQGNTTPPADDPGIGHVGSIGDASGVYLGNGWVITVNHVAIGPYTLDGQTYDDVPGSKVRLDTPGVGLADLAVFKIDGDPGLPAMNIASSSIGVNDGVIMHGHGRDRGLAVTWPETGGDDGWQWGAGHSLRWGTNRVAGASQTVLDTAAFLTVFDESGFRVEADEAQAVYGDSGGAVFYKRGNSWELTGIMFAIGKNAAEQPGNYVLFGNQTLAADLAVYRSQILSIIDQPTCDDGLDEDGDGLIDYPADPGCASANDSDERDPNLVCDDGVDQDGDGLTDWPADPGCDDSFDDSEQSPALACDDGADQDGDGLTDWPADPGCESASDDSEQSLALVCDDGIDNEGDGLTDHTEDPDCGGDPVGTSEGATPVPLSPGAGAGVLATVLGWLGRARAARFAS